MKKETNKIVISNIDPTNTMLINGMADLYANVFAGPPWNEVTKCVKSNTFYGSDTQAGKPCPDCQAPLMEAYPKDETTSYILRELGKTNPIGLLAFVNNELAGFSWGYQTNVQGLVESKWKTPKMRQTVEDLLSEYGVKDQLFYGSETGVDPQFQGKGIGKQLVRNRLIQVNNSESKFMIVRTNINSSMYGICQNMGQFTQIMGPVAETGWFNKKYKPSYRYINTIDSENTDRVLFLYDKAEYKRRTERRDYTFGDGMH